MFGFYLVTSVDDCNSDYFCGDPLNRSTWDFICPDIEHATLISSVKDMECVSYLLNWGYRVFYPNTGVCDV